MFKRGVVTTVLIIAIIVVSVSALTFIGYQIYLHDASTEDQCLAVLDNNYILEDRYSCNTQEFTAFSLSLIGSGANGAKAILKSSDGTQEEIELKDGASYQNLRTLTSNFGEAIDVNEEGQKVIVVEGRYDSVEIHPLVDSGACGVGDSYFFGSCDSETEDVLDISSEVIVPIQPTNNTNVSTTRPRSGGGGGGGSNNDNDDDEPPVNPVPNVTNTSHAPIVEILAPTDSTIITSISGSFSLNITDLDEDLFLWDNSYRINVVNRDTGEFVIQDLYYNMFHSNTPGIISHTTGGIFTLPDINGTVNYTLTVIVPDRAGNEGNDSVNFSTSLDVPNLFPPAASFSAIPQSGVTPLIVNFDASSSHDPDGNITKYNWVYGDGSTCDDCGPLVSHQFMNTGTDVTSYTVVLTVTDDDDLTNPAQEIIIVNPDSDNDGISNAGDNCPFVSNAAQDDLDGDGEGDVCDNNIDGDIDDNSLDCNDLNPDINTGATEICTDGIDNNCNDLCDSVTGACADGSIAGDAACGAFDSDGDGIPDSSDSDPNNPNVCRDSDSDSCDDCSAGEGFDPNNDGIDTDTDGMCNLGDDDDDNDGVDDITEIGEGYDPWNPFICGDFDDGDTCDDCSVVGFHTPSNDGPDLDGDGMCDLGDDQTCNNGILETGELCDGGSHSCTLNGYSGTQLCNSQCNGYGLCDVGPQRCGDGVINGNEECDGTNFGDLSCQNYDLIGFLTCTSSCTIDSSSCVSPPPATVNILSPSNGQTFDVDQVDIQFDTNDFQVLGKGNTHIHFYLDSDTTPYMFYNGADDTVEYNGITATSALRIAPGNIIRFIDLDDGQHTVTAVLANADHSELTNPEATESVSFEIDTTPIVTGTYYVATTGSDSNPGTLAQPFLTINHAALIASAGDTIFVRGGNYGLADLSSISNNNYIIIQNYNNEQVNVAGFDIINSDHIIVEGLKVTAESEIRDSDHIEVHDSLFSPGLSSDALVFKNNNDVVINNNEFTNFVNGIPFGGILSSRINITNNYLHDFRIDGMQIKLNDGFILNNTIFRSNPQTGDHSDALQFVHEGNNVVVRSNKISQVQQAILLNTDQPGKTFNNFVIEGNLIYGDQSSGDETISQPVWHFISLYGATNPVIRGNTIIARPTTSPVRETGQILLNTASNGQVTTGAIVKNNIAPRLCGVAGTVALEDYNLYYGDLSSSSKCVDGSPTGSAQVINTGANNVIVSDSGFVNRAGFDYHLASTSPAIDSGINEGYGFDLEDNPRPQGSGRDIGAYEYTGVVTTPVCGDGIINQASEECDGINFGSYGDGINQCSLYDSQYQSGNLGCVPSGQAGECTVSTTGCSTEPASCISPVDEWINQAFAPQASTFTITYDDTPAEDSFNGNIVGLSLEEGNDFSDYSIVVRFSNGNIDARNGGSYSSTNTVPYTLGTTYHIRLEVDVITKTYDVFVTPAGGSEVQLANDFGFRTGQDDVDYLANLGVFSDGGGTSTADHTVCNFAMTPAQPVCGNGIVETDEDCDDGDQNSGDGCSASCTIESGYSCNGFPSSTCTQITECNDGDDNDNDGYTDELDFSCQQGGPDEDTFLAECQDGVDNADPEDILIDSNDPGCFSTQDNDETDALAGTILEPGDGWTSLLTQPAAIGDPSDFGYDAQAIARWDVVPFQDFSGQFEIGVVAFHINGIDRVEFSVDNGPWVAVDEMTLNPRTNVVEYWATLNASLFDGDGPVEVRAIVYPNIGEPRVLGGNPFENDRSLAKHGNNALLLNSNAQGTLPVAEVWVDSINGNDANSGAEASPVKTIRAGASKLRTFLNNGNDVGGGIINLMAGDHEWAGGSATGYSTSTRWMIVRPDPALSNPSLARVTTRAWDQNMPKLVKVDGLVIVPDASIGLSARSHVFREGAADQGYHIWFDNMLFDGVDKLRGIDATSLGYTGKYATNSLIKETVNGFAGPLVRDSLVDDILSDAYTNARLVINSEAKNLGASGSGAHPDIWQLQGTDDQNMIIYNFRAVANVDAQGLFASGDRPSQNDIQNFSGLAIVNATVDTSAGLGNPFKLGNGVDQDGVGHLYIKDSYFVNLPSSFWTGTFPLKNVVVENSFFFDGNFLVPKEDDPETFPGIQWLQDNGAWTSPDTGVVYRLTPPPLSPPLSDDNKEPTFIDLWEKVIGEIKNLLTGKAVSENNEFTGHVVNDTRTDNGSHSTRTISIFLIIVLIIVITLYILSILKHKGKLKNFYNSF